MSPTCGQDRERIRPCQQLKSRGLALCPFQYIGEVNGCVLVSRKLNAVDVQSLRAVPVRTKVVPIHQIPDAIYYNLGARKIAHSGSVPLLGGRKEPDQRVILSLVELPFSVSILNVVVRTDGLPGRTADTPGEQKKNHEDRGASDGNFD